MAKMAYHFMVPSSLDRRLLHAAVVSSEGYGAALQRLRRDDPIWDGPYVMIASTEGRQLPAETGLQFSDRRLVMWLSEAVNG